MVQCCFLLVQIPELQPEQYARDGRKDYRCAVVPNEKRVLRERDEYLAEHGQDGARDEKHAHDERAHMPGRLRERVLERGHRR